jgi:condensin complex subunit 3
LRLRYLSSLQVGRRTMQSLATTVLQNNNFTIKLTKKLVSVAQKCSSNIEFFTCDMCQLISDVREPLVEEPMSQDHQRERDFKVAELRVKINILREKQNEAVNQRDYQTAQILDNELVSCNKQLEELQNQTSTQMIRMRRPDNETLCCCLDILASVLELPVVDKLTPSLVTCRDHFLVPLISSQSAESHWRVLKCLALFSVIDKATAEEYAKVICIPIATYRTVPMNNVSALIQSVCGVTDIISLYGVEIVSQNEETDNTTLNQNMTKRKLYSTDSEDDMTNGKIDNMTLSYIFEIFLDMLDDEREEIRYKAVLAITALIKQSFPVTPTLFSRILLKWYSPLTEKQDIRLEVYLGLLIDQYLQCRNSIDVMKETIVPTLSSIANAPKTSPLADIDVDNVLMFFSENMNISLEPVCKMFTKNT